MKLREVGNLSEGPRLTYRGLKPGDVFMFISGINRDNTPRIRTFSGHLDKAFYHNMAAQHNDKHVVLLDAELVWSRLEGGHVCCQNS